MQRDRTRYEKVCEVCEHVFSVNKTELGRRKYCSYYCRDTFKRKEKIEVTCQNPACLKKLEVRPGRAKNIKFCSRSCSDICRYNPKEHHLSKSSTYNSWMSMRMRCDNPKATAFPFYGGRGITYCEQWKDFRNFLADMGESPSNEYSIDRINTFGNYEPGNCRWLLKKLQSKNARNNVSITHNGETKLLAEWAHSVGLRTSTFQERLKRGWDMEKALTHPVQKRSKTKRANTSS